MQTESLQGRFAQLASKGDIQKQGGDDRKMARSVQEYRSPALLCKFCTALYKGAQLPAHNV